MYSSSQWYRNTQKKEIRILPTGDMMMMVMMMMMMMMIIIICIVHLNIFTHK